MSAGDEPIGAIDPSPMSAVPGELESFLRHAERQPWRYDLFWLIRAIDRARFADDPAAPRVGDAFALRDDAVRFGQTPHMKFAPVAVDAIAPATEFRPRRVRVHSFGLAGANGPLPSFLIEHICRRVAHGETAWRAFLDMLQHRLITLFYRAWAMHQPVVQHDRPEHDQILGDILSLMGLSLGVRHGDGGVPDEAKAHLAGRVIPTAKSADSLEAALSTYFGVRARVVCFRGEWIDIPVENRLRIGESPRTGQLGVSTVVGERIWNIQQRFRVTLGPMPMRDFERFLPRPGSRTCRRLIEWVGLLSGAGLTWDLQLVLRRDDAPAAQLGSGAMLGWTTWIRNAPPARDLDELTIEPSIDDVLGPAGGHAEQPDERFAPSDA